MVLHGPPLGSAWTPSVGGTGGNVSLARCLDLCVSGNRGYAWVPTGASRAASLLTSVGAASHGTRHKCGRCVSH